MPLLDSTHGYMYHNNNKNIKRLVVTPDINKHIE